MTGKLPKVGSYIETDAGRAQVIAWAGYARNGRGHMSPSWRTTGVHVQFEDGTLGTVDSRSAKAMNS